ncbi:hypothetical protein V8G54_029561 [Vigna mungo]|uniref:Uncharacterized protein n=1 Tax=Vigna mungo TaxID=3915 RepID=A0AAQ3MUV7_VIGMU
MGWRLSESEIVFTWNLRNSLTSFSFSKTCRSTIQVLLWSRVVGGSLALVTLLVICGKSSPLILEEPIRMASILEPSKPLCDGKKERDNNRFLCVPVVSELHVSDLGLELVGYVVVFSDMFIILVLKCEINDVIILVVEMHSTEFLSSYDKDCWHTWPKVTIMTRFDFSWDDPEYHQETLENLRTAIKSTRKLCAVMVKNVTRLFSTKPIVTINGKFSGPTIYAREDDIVLVKGISSKCLCEENGLCDLCARVINYRQVVIDYPCLCTKSPTLLPDSSRGGSPVCGGQNVIAYQCLCTKRPTLLPSSSRGGSPVCGGVFHPSACVRKMDFVTYVPVASVPKVQRCSLALVERAPQCVVVMILRLMVVLEDQQLLRGLLGYFIQCLCTKSPTLLPGSGRGSSPGISSKCLCEQEGLCDLCDRVIDYRQAVIAYQCLCTKSPTLLLNSGRGGSPVCGGVFHPSACVRKRDFVIYVPVASVPKVQRCSLALVEGVPQCVGISSKCLCEQEGLCDLCDRVIDYRQAVIAYQCLCTKSPTLLPGSGRGGSPGISSKCLCEEEELCDLCARCLCTKSPTLVPGSGRGSSPGISSKCLCEQEGLCDLCDRVIDYRQAVIAYQFLCTKSPTLLPDSGRGGSQVCGGVDPTQNFMTLDPRDSTSRHWDIKKISTATFFLGGFGTWRRTFFSMELVFAVFDFG